jgi:ribose-phosphate pyrophosphokinase
MKDKKVFLVCTLDLDTKLLLYFFAKTAKEFGAKSICLIAPYLACARTKLSIEVKVSPQRILQI